MRFTMTFKPWEIVLIPFPFTDLTTSKRRPAVVLSPESYNEGHDIVLMFLTSNLKTAPKLGDHLISDWKGAGLPKPTISRMKFATIEKKLILKKIGQIKSADVNTIKSKLKSFLSI
ncbi:MAG: type II toxin-antitoxin system PemK/MazF family toxin [bacterium]|nr:type II toxin-antitoxin system PemK/MazF family toxin [bacterium]